MTSTDRSSRPEMKLAYIVCAGILLLAGSAAAQEGDKAISRKTAISLGTATPGGGFPLYGNAFAEVMNAADPTLSIEPRNTKGSNENIPLLEAGQLDIALVAGEPAYEAFMGLGRPATTAENPHRDVFLARHVRGACRQPLQDHPRSRRPAGRVRRQGLGPADPVALHARRPRPEAGRGFQVDLSRPCRRRAGDGAGRPRRGAVGRGHRLARISPRWRESPGGARFIAPDADEIARIRAKHAFLKPLTVPAGCYPDQTAPIDSVGSWSFVLVRENLPDDVAYRLARTLHGVEGDVLQEAGAGLRNHGGQHGRGRAEAGADSSRRDEVFEEIGVAKYDAAWSRKADPYA